MGATDKLLAISESVDDGWSLDDSKEAPAANPVAPLVAVPASARLATPVNEGFALADTIKLPMPARGSAVPPLGCPRSPMVSGPSCRGRGTQRENGAPEVEIPGVPAYWTAPEPPAELAQGTVEEEEGEAAPDSVPVYWRADSKTTNTTFSDSDRAFFAEGEAMSEPEKLDAFFEYVDRELSLWQRIWQRVRDRSR